MEPDGELELDARHTAVFEPGAMDREPGQDSLVDHAVEKLAANAADNSDEASKLAGCFNPNFSGNPTTVYTSPVTLYAFAVNDMFACPYGTYISVRTARKPPGVTVNIQSTSYPYQKRVEMDFSTRAPLTSKFRFCIKVWQNVTNRYLGERCFDRTIRLRNGCDGNWRVHGVDRFGNSISDTRHGYVDNSGCNIHWTRHTVTGCRETRGADGRTAYWQDTNGDQCPDKVTVYNPSPTPNEVFSVSIN